MTGRDDLFQQAMNQGHSAAWDQLWDRAAGFYRQALDEFPDNLHALTSLGLALYELQNFEESARCYERAARLSTGDPLPFEKLAQLYERLGNIPHAVAAALQAAELYLRNRDANKAIENWTRVTRLSPENQRAHSRLALIYERMEQKKQAATEYLALASLFQQSNEAEKAVRAVNQALLLNPESKEAQHALALLRDFKPLPKPSRPRGGTAPLRMAQVRQLDAPKTDQPESSLDPVGEARQNALTLLAGMLFESPEEDQSDQATRRGLQALMQGKGNLLPRQVDRTRIMLHLSQVVDLQTRGNFSQAAEELERAIDAGLDHSAAYFDLGLLLEQDGQLEHAVRELQQAVKHPDFALGARLLLAQALQKLGRLKEASGEYLEALRLADSAVVEIDQADDLRQLYEPLIEAQNQETDPETHEQLCTNIAGLLMQANWRERLTLARQQLPVQADGSPPIPLAEILTQVRSSQVVESLTKIYQLAQTGSLRSAMEEAFYALQFAPTYLPLHTYMGKLLIQQEQLPEAIAKFTMVAQSYSVRGESVRAIDLYRRVIELAPMALNPRGQLIDMLISVGQIEEALQEYLELADVYYSLADLDMTRKTYAEALRLAQQSKVDRSWRVQILHRIADIDLQSLDWRQAQRIFEQIRTLQPSDEDARSSLIELNFRLGQEAQALAELDNFIAYLNSTGHKESAIKFLEGMVHEYSERPLVRTRLAELYRQMGRVTDAIAQLDAAGEMMMDAGDRDGAARVVESILALNPPNLGEYQRLLSQLRGK